MVHDLSDEQFCVPLLRTINPFLWEIGHVAYFQEHWVLRHAAGGSPLHADADALYDSAKVPHDTRWSLPLPARVVGGRLTVVALLGSTSQAARTIAHEITAMTVVASIVFSPPS